MQRRARRNQGQSFRPWSLPTRCWLARLRGPSSFLAQLPNPAPAASFASPSPASSSLSHALPSASPMPSAHVSSPPSASASSPPPASSSSLPWPSEAAVRGSRRRPAPWPWWSDMDSAVGGGECHPNPVQICFSPQMKKFPAVEMIETRPGAL